MKFKTLSGTCPLEKEVGLCGWPNADLLARWPSLKFRPMQIFRVKLLGLLIISMDSICQAFQFDWRFSALLG